MYFIGEALIGSGNEVAHIDLVIGDKNSPAGTAFVNNLTQLSIGHTPLLSVIRPNLITKPATLIIPKVTVRDLCDAEKIFGPAQNAVSRAVVDAVAEGLIPEDKAEDIVILVSVFIHPEAEDYRKIYQYNYGATKLAVRRAMEGYPSVGKVLAEKDRCAHPTMAVSYTHLTLPTKA